MASLGPNDLTYPMALSFGTRLGFTSFESPVNFSERYDNSEFILRSVDPSPDLALRRLVA